MPSGKRYSAEVGPEWPALRGRDYLGLPGPFADHAAIALDNARLYEEAQRTVSDLRLMQCRLVQGETLRGLGELAAGAAHHIDNLLTIVVGRIQLLRRTVTEERLLRPLRSSRGGQGRGGGRTAPAAARRHAAHSGAAHRRPQPDCNGRARMSRPSWQESARAEETDIVVESRLALLPEIAVDPTHLATRDAEQPGAQLTDAVGRLGLGDR